MSDYNIEQEYTIRHKETGDTLKIMGGAVEGYLAVKDRDDQGKEYTVFELVE